MGSAGSAGVPAVGPGAALPSVAATRESLERVAEAEGAGAEAFEIPSIHLLQ